VDDALGESQILAVERVLGKRGFKPVKGRENETGDADVTGQMGRIKSVAAMVYLAITAGLMRCRGFVP